MSASTSEDLGGTDGRKSAAGGPGLDATTSREAAARILSKANRQFGVISRRQALRAGVSPGRIEWLLRRLWLLTVHPGLYAVGRPITEDRQFWMAGVLATGPGAVLARSSAACLWGIAGNRRRQLDRVEILRPESRKPRFSRLQGYPRSWQLHVRRSSKLPDHHMTRVDRIPVTTVERTLLDLAGETSRERLEFLFLEADRLGLIDDARIGEIVEFGARRPGISGLRALVESRNPHVRETRSILEALFLARSHETGLPQPETNKLIGRYSVDFVWEEAKLIVETDGRAYHRGAVQLGRDVEKENYLKRREYEVIRVTWYEVEGRLPETAELIERLFFERFERLRATRLGEAVPLKS